MAITERRDWVDRMEKAGTDTEACWAGFCDACQELVEVCSASKLFGSVERNAAISLETVAQDAGGPTEGMNHEFENAYDVFGAPGDWSYERVEGRAIQAVYEWWLLVTEAQ